MKHGEMKKIGGSWHIYKWKKGTTGATAFSSGFGDGDEIAICGSIFYSKYQLKKDMKRGKCI